jgi:hypothetical protein
MKDLRFKIIADFVRQGFDRAGGAVQALKSKFAEFFNGAKAGWTGMATVIGVVVASIYKAGEAMRQGWLSQIKRMRDDTYAFMDDSARNWRLIKSIDTDEDKARVVEKLDRQIREKDRLRDEIRTDEDSESWWDKAKGAGAAAKSWVAGLGFEEESELKYRQLGEQIAALQKEKQAALNRETKDAAKAAEEKAKAEADAERERKEAADRARQARLAADRSRHETELAWAREEAAAWQASFDAQVKGAMEAAKKREQLLDLVEGVNTVRRNIALAEATPQQQQQMDARRFAQVRNQAMAKNELGDFALPPEKRAALITEGLEIRARMRRRSAEMSEAAAKEGEEKDDEERTAGPAKKRHRQKGEPLTRGGFRGGLRWRAGSMSEAAASVRPSDTDDPHLREAKRHTDLLERIEKKTGAAP